MIYPTNLGLQEHEIFDFNEVCADIVGTLPPFAISNLSQYMKLYSLLEEDDGTWTNTYDWSFVDTTADADLIHENALTLLNKLYLRYRSHYCVDLVVPYTLLEKTEKFSHFFEKVLKVLDYTFVRYSTLLDLYENQKEHLLDKLGRSRSGSRSISQTGQNAENSISLYNDAPQTTDVVATMEQNQYAKDLTKNSIAGSTASSGTDAFSETEEWDTKTMMAKLDEIEKQFSNVWMKWLNEFDELFVEEVNY